MSLSDWFDDEDVPNPNSSVIRFIPFDMASLVLHLLTVVIAVLFLFFGHLKLTGQFFPDYHKQIKNEFGKFNNEFPLHRQTGWRPYAKNYRLAVGITEVTCGVLLLLGETVAVRPRIYSSSSAGIWPNLANIVLILSMTNGIVTLTKLNYGVEYIAGLILVSFLLVFRLVLVSRSSAAQPVKSPRKKVE